MENVTVLFPGGFKPITGAHLDLANRYAQNSAVSEVIFLIGSKEREGITREQSIQAFNILNTNPKIKIQPTEFNSPIMASYEYLFELPEDATGTYALAASKKDDDYKRAVEYSPNVEKYKTIGDRKGRKIPAGIDAVELAITTDPMTHDDGTPISATATREAINNADYAAFTKCYPGYQEAQLKNVYQIYTKKSPPSLSTEWWVKEISKDIDDLFEGFPTYKVSNAHNSKLKKLRNHLDNNVGKEFVYNFDDFEKTVFGVKKEYLENTDEEVKKENINENYITRQELSQIEAAADRFFKQYGIDVDMQGKFTHFFDRLNDPRNEAPVYMHELEDMFKELADRYGEEIASQLRHKRDTAVVSDLATDVPIHMPFMLKYDRRDDAIKLIPRTIKKQRRKWQSNNPKDVKYTIESTLLEGTLLTEGGAAGHMAHPYDAHGLTFNDMKELIDRTVVGVNLNEINLTEVKYTLPNFDTEWEEAIRYPEFKEMGKSKWIQIANQGEIKNYSSIKNVLSNVDLNFDKLEEPKKQRFIAALDNGIIEMPIAVKFGDADYDLVAGNTRLSGLTKSGINSKIWIVDISNLSEGLLRERVVSNESLLMTEGGAAGHMAHPYDDHGLTFNDMKELIDRALSGRLDIEDAATEKTDGQNIQVTWKDNQIGFARNKGTIKQPLSTQELISKFEGRGPISDAFTKAGEDLQSAFMKVDPNLLNNIFKNGSVFANMEIIYPATANVISYDVAVLQFHNLVEYDENANVVETDLNGGNVIQKIIQDANANMQKTFSFIPPRKIKLGRVSDYEDQQAALFSEVDSLMKQYDLKPDDLITEYHRAWWEDVVLEQAEKMSYDIPTSLLDLLVDRWAFNDKSTSIVKIKQYIENEEFKNWVVDFDKKDVRQAQKQNIEPFESIFLRLGAIVLSNAKDFLAANPSKSVQSIRSDLSKTIKDLKATNNIELIKKVEYQLKRIQKLGGFDKIVPIEGIVFTFKGNTYKLTGAFAPVNQLLGVLKFAR